MLLLAYDPGLLTGVRRIFARSVLSFVSALAKQQCGVDGRSGAVCAVQRFGSDLRANAHFHMLVLDGVHTRQPSGAITFTELRSPSLAELERLTRSLHRRILRFLKKRGKLPEDEATADDATLGELSAHELCLLGAVHGVEALGPSAGRRAPRLFDKPDEPLAIEPKQSKRAKKLACRFEGFSLHAGTRVRASQGTRASAWSGFAATSPGRRSSTTG